MELEYSEKSYKQYVKDIKKDIKERRELPDANGYYDDFEDGDCC